MKRYLLWLAAALIIVGGIVVYEVTSTPAPAAAAAPSVQVDMIKLAPGRLPSRISGYGSLMAGPAAEASVTLQAAGIVTTIPVLPGQPVSAGEAVAVIAPDAQSVADYHRAEDALAAARANRAHVAALLAGHLATTADLAAARQGVADATATLAALRSTQAGAGRSIPAPFDGTVTAILVASGTAQPAGTALLRMVRTGGLVAMISLPPRQAALVKPGDPASLDLLNGGTPVSADVSQVGAMQDPQTGLVDVTLRPAATAPLALNAPAMATITTGDIAGFVVPRDAVQTDQQGDYAFQVDAKNIAHRVTVKVLGQDGDQTVLAPDLNTSMMLVTTGAYQLDDGVAVRSNADSGASH